MKNCRFILLSSLALLLFSASCTIEKRVHRNGYHVEWNAKKRAPLSSGHSDRVQVKTKSAEPLDERSAQLDNTYASIDESGEGQGRSRISLWPNKDRKDRAISMPCDTLVMNDQSILLAKVLEVGISDITYKMCDNPDGPTFTKAKSQVRYIAYPNGSRSDFGRSGRVVNQNKSPSSQDIDYAATVNSDDKSFVLAILLWFFLGLLGIHRFYLGHIGMGVLYLLTAGLCGIGWIVDGILLVTGNLQPKNGVYLDE